MVDGGGRGFQPFRLNQTDGQTDDVDPLALSATYLDDLWLSPIHNN